MEANNLICRMGHVVDGSGTITTANTSQQVFATNLTRRYLFIQSTTSALGVDFGAAATLNTRSIMVPIGGSLVFETGFIPCDSITIICATQGAAFIAKQG